MKLGGYLKILHPYIGAGCDKNEFIPYLCTLIMHTPHTPAEKKPKKLMSIIRTMEKTRQKGII